MTTCASARTTTRATSCVKGCVNAMTTRKENATGSEKVSEKENAGELCVSEESGLLALEDGGDAVGTGAGSVDAEMIVDAIEQGVSGHVDRDEEMAKAS
ncbi:hypothetical protein SERLA73DRAFT_192076, partial [Serpula lacrymans var. lacrymans S7.3]